MSAGAGSKISERWRIWQGQIVGGRFRLIQYLGGSQNSDVFLTESSDGATRKQAIKLIPANPQTARMQLARWEMASRLVHPYLLGVSEFGECQIGDARLLFAVTDYAEENLAQILPQRPLTPDEAKDMLQSVLDVLAYLHGQDVVHGQLKPSNIMAAGNQLKVSSDGILPAGGPTDSSRQKTLYDAPESSRTGKTPATDVWALAVVMVEALTQLPPVSQGTEEPVLPSDLPEPFREIARHCLAPDPQRRWTVDAIAQHLRSANPVAPVAPKIREIPRAVPTGRIPSPAVSPAQRAQHPASQHQGLGKWRYRVLAIAAGILAVTLLAGKMFRPRTEPTETVKDPGVSVARPSAPAIPAPAVASAQPAAKSIKPVAPAPVPKPRAQAASTGSVVEQVLPTIPKSARNTIQGHIRIAVRVTVDPSGNVVSTKLVSPGPSQYFARLTDEAARHWKFQADTTEAAARDWLLRFEITRKGTSVNPTPASR